MDNNEYKHWAEVIAEQAIEEFGDDQIVSAGWSPSGEYHIGNSREAVTCHAIDQSLQDLNVSSKFVFVIDNFDPLDKIPHDLKKYSKKLRPYLGHPISEVPDFTGEFDTYAEYFASGAIKAMDDFNFNVEFVYAEELYRSGKYDQYLDIYLARQDQIDQLFEEISGSALNSYVSVICEHCGNMKTPQISSISDGIISFTCISDRMYRGCEKEGSIKISSHDWKLKWRLDWPARQKFLGVTVEPSGKDHSVAGGSVDTAVAIHNRIFEEPSPLLEKYGFINLKGAKMSGSRGGALPASKISDIMPASAYLYLIYRSDLLKDIEFNPESMEYAKLLDEFDDARRMYHGINFEGREREFNKLSTAAELAMFPDEQNHIPADVKFEELALVYQTSLMQKDLTIGKFEALGKIPSTEAKNELKIRLDLVDEWLTNMAPANVKIQFLEEVPESAEEYWTPEVKTVWTDALKSIEPDTDADDFTTILREKAEEKDLNPREYYQAFYQLVSGKKSGPNAANLVLAMGKDAVLEKIKSL